MSWLKIKKKYYILRSQIGRRSRMLYISPAEVRFIRIMGGHVVTFYDDRHPRTKFPLAYVVSLGRFLKRHGYEREVRVGKSFVDFGDVERRRGLEIDGRDWHMDVVKEMERDEYMRQFGWTLFHIQAADLWRNPDYVQRQVLQFMARK
ncbi:MAG: DUF559 domain-containing protein [Flavobacteriales bacterium]|nr:DUF559 domain-containing protein [Flavobacteriales bacterium]